MCFEKKAHSGQKIFQMASLEEKENAFSSDFPYWHIVYQYTNYLINVQLLPESHCKVTLQESGANKY